MILKNKKYYPKPQITISIEPILEAYLRFVFNTPADQKTITINLKKDLGKLIHSHVHSSHCLRKSPSIVNPVNIILPVNESNQHGVLSGFLYVDVWGLKKIENGIDYEFSRWLKERFERGYRIAFENGEEFKNSYRRKQIDKAIIEAILRALDIRHNSINFERIKKIVYRNYRKEQEIRFEKLLSIDN